jgi:hypothetical protein
MPVSGILEKIFLLKALPSIVKGRGISSSLNLMFFLDLRTVISPVILMVQAPSILHGIFWFPVPVPVANMGCIAGVLSAGETVAGGEKLHVRKKLFYLGILHHRTP